MRAMLIQLLRERPEVIPELARAFEHEWPEWYGPGGRGSALHDLGEFANAEGRLPIGVVALAETGRPLGVGALKAVSIPEYAHVAPWVAAGYVVAELRGRGIGAALVHALVAEAHSLGYGTVYCATATAGSLLQRIGWVFVEQVLHEGSPVSVYRCDGSALSENPYA